MNIEEIARSLGKPKRTTNGGWTCLCPCHDDHEQSLSLNVGDKQPIVVCCHAGCAGEDIVAELKRRDLWTNGLNGDARGKRPPARSRVQQESKDQGDAIIPVPPDAAPPPARHRVHGLSTFSWPWHDASGALRCFTNRFDPPGRKKVVLPLTYRQFADGSRRWAWLGAPVPHPVLGLPDVLANDLARVVIVAGEKCRDAARKVFPGAVCTTGFGGEGNITGTDWAPLAGRKVLLWRDCDSEGEVWERGLAAILLRLGCQVQIVDAAALAAIDPNGGKREPPVKWDCADAILIDHWDLGALRDAALERASQVEPDEADFDDLLSSPVPEVRITEDGLALEFVDRHGTDLRYVALWAKWLKWSGHNWQNETTLAAYDYARQISREASQWFKDNKRKPPSHLAKSKTFAAIETISRSDRRVASTTEQWDTDQMLFNTRKGSASLKGERE